MELRQALDTHHELCDAFDNLLLAETHEDAEGKRIWLTHRFINGGEEAMHALAEVARSVLDAPRIWWCVEHGATGESTGCHIGWRHQERPHPADSPCRMVGGSVVVDDPQEHAHAELLGESTADFEAERLILNATELILELMEHEGLTRSELAERIGKSKGHVSQLLNGERNMTLRTLAEIAHAVGHRIEVRAALSVEGNG